MALPTRRASTPDNSSQLSNKKIEDVELPPVDDDFSLPELDELESDSALPSLEDIALPTLDLPELETEDLDETPINEPISAPAPADEEPLDDFDALFDNIAEEVGAPETDETISLDWDDLGDATPAITPIENEVDTSFIDEAFSEIEESEDDPLETLEVSEGESNDWAADFEKILDEDSEDDTALDTNADKDQDETEELDDQDSDGAEDNSEALKSTSKKGKTKKRAKGNPISRLSEKLFAILAGTPIIGRLFKPFKRFAGFLLPVIILLLLLGIPFGLYTYAGNSIENPPALTFPDGGSAKIGSLKFDESSITASGVIKNTGDVIAEVQPVFTVWTYQFSINPAQWVAYTKLGTCTGDFTTVDIDAKTDVSASCDFDSTTGITPKITGSLNY